MKKWRGIPAVLLLVWNLCLFAGAEEKRPTLLVLGDSIAYGEGLTDPVSQCYGALVAEQEGFSLINRAVNGYMSRDLLALLEENGSLREQVTQADLLVISIGGNDFLRQVDRMLEEILDGNRDTLEGILQDLEENLDGILIQIRKLNPQVPILLQTLYNPFYSPLRVVCGGMIDRLNNVYRKYLENHPGAYELLDVAEAFEGHPEYIADDHIHPSAAGHEAISQVLTVYLEGTDQPVAGPGPTQIWKTETFPSVSKIAPEVTDQLKISGYGASEVETVTSETIQDGSGAEGVWVVIAVGVAGTGILTIIVRLVLRHRK